MMRRDEAEYNDVRPLWAGVKPLFEIYPGKADDVSPIFLSVPHAGRDYAPAILNRTRVPWDAMVRLEDRLADMLITGLTERGYPALVAHVPRSVIDLNRDPADIDPDMISDLPRGASLIQSAKQRGGLGIFPRSLARCGQLWRGPMPWEEAQDRIAAMHGGYHARLEQEINRIAARYDQILLIDVHSMPPLPPPMSGERRTDIVIGNRYGASASDRLANVARFAAKECGLTAELNRPYAGYYLIERHGRPVSGRHALQIEISRDLYLDEAMEQPGAGLGHMQGVLLHIVEALHRELVRGQWAEAAE